MYFRGAARSTAPVFDASAQVTSKSSFGKIKVLFPGAESTDGMSIFLYRVKVYSENGELVQSKWVLNDYWKMPVSESFSLKLDKLAGGTYTVSVTAETAYGVVSKLLGTQITVK